MFHNKPKILLSLFITIICILLLIFVYYKNNKVEYINDNFSGSKINTENNISNHQSNIIFGSLPDLNGEKVAVNIKSKVGSIGINDAIKHIGAAQNKIITIRSYDELYSDGKSPRYEILLLDNGNIIQNIISNNGIVSKNIITTSIKENVVFPKEQVDYSAKIKKIFLNDYFSKTYIRGAALYFDFQDKKWKYILRTEIGDMAF